MRPRLHPAVRVRHAGFAVVVFVLAAVSVWFGGAAGIESPLGRTQVFGGIPAGEIIVVLHAALTAVLLHPRLMPWELRRRPTRWAAAGAAAWTVGSTAALAVVVWSRLIATYSTPEGQPQAEVVINNALFTAGVVLIGVVLLGPLRGAATGMAVYVAGYLVLMTRSTEFFWPSPP